ncbi:SEC14-like protein 4 [Rhipicephalus sanguineus]|uniref:SEC14-like protein 4 n=1 Tax=Rhipicephalus sanguineus TaxID=34632 RepID=UPI00189516D1|nr:SEC14-like protein 4 [Rhipicephalus sanguineus]
MSGYPGNLNAGQQAALDQFRNAVADVQRTSDTDAFLLRWLRARDFDVANAEKMYRDHLKWRMENGVDDMLHSYEIPEIVRKNFPGFFLHPCKDGRPMFMVPYGLNVNALLEAMTPAVLIRHCIYLLEYAESLCRRSSNELGREIHGLYTVADMDRLVFRHIYSWQVLKTTAVNFRMMEDNYPECQEKVIVINAPSFYSMLWKFMRTLLSERTASKFEVYGKDGWKERLLEIADADSLPACWGGDMVGPDGDPRCRHKVNYGGRFEEAESCSVFDEKDARQQTIGRRERWELPINVLVPGALINWRFQTSAGDVAFGLRMLSGRSLVPVQRLRACSHTPQEGSWHCDAPGTYVLEFDNTYSWLNGKTLAYVVNVIPPEEIS